MALIMLTPILYPYIKFALGNLYPAYKTWKALKRKDITTRVSLLNVIILIETKS